MLILISKQIKQFSTSSVTFDFLHDCINCIAFTLWLFTIYKQFNQSSNSSICNCIYINKTPNATSTSEQEQTNLETGSLILRELSYPHNLYILPLSSQPVLLFRTYMVLFLINIQIVLRIVFSSRVHCFNCHLSKHM